ncbi:MAG TPA: type II secretion system protein [Planctomycetota bacterium]|nr:type II secretion system protein [Planctomycetota bacterium]
MDLLRSGRFRRRRVGAAGFTLIEAMVSMAILAFVLLVFLGVVFSADSLRASSREASVAMQDLQSAVEYTFAPTFDKFKQNYPTNTSFRGQTAADGTTLLPDFYDDPSTPALERALRMEEITITWTAQDPGPAIEWVEYKVEVTWRDHKNRVVRESVVTKRSK